MREILIAFAPLLNTIAIGVIAVLMFLLKRDVRIIEKATNSMKDALVASTAKASHAEGVIEGKASR